MQKISGSFFGHNLCPVWPEKNCQMSIKVDNFTKNAKECGIFGQINCRRKFNKSPNLVTLCVPLIFGPTYFVGWHYLKLMCLKFCVIPYCVTLTSPLHSFISILCDHFFGPSTMLHHSFIILALLRVTSTFHRQLLCDILPLYSFRFKNVLCPYKHVPFEIQYQFSQTFISLCCQYSQKMLENLF